MSLPDETIEVPRAVLENLAAAASLSYVKSIASGFHLHGGAEFCEETRDAIDQTILLLGLDLAEGNRLLTSRIAAHAAKEAARQ